MNLHRTVILTFVAAGIAIAALWWTHRAVAPREAAWEDVLAEARNGGYRLMTTTELAQECAPAANDLLLVDTRQDWEYRAGHIKGAISFPMEPTWWSRWRKAGALKNLIGPDKNRKVVFY